LGYFSTLELALFTTNEYLLFFPTQRNCGLFYSDVIATVEMRARASPGITFLSPRAVIEEVS